MDVGVGGGGVSRLGKALTKMINAIIFHNIVIAFIHYD